MANFSRHSAVFTVIGLLFLFFCIAMGIYHGGLASPMYYDSGAKLEARGHFFDHGVLSALKVFPQRPLPVLTFHSNYLLTGMTPGYFRLTNLFLLASLSVVVALLVRLVLETPALSLSVNPSDRNWLSFFMGLAFLVHPLHTYVTLYIWQRMALMACLFYCASLTVYLAVRGGRIRSKLYGTGLAVILFACAVLSKENSVTLPGVVLIAERAFFQQQWKAAFRTSLPYFMTLLGLMLLGSFVQFPHGNERMNAGIVSTLEAYYQESGLNLTEVVLTQCRVLFSYLSLIVAPLPWRVQLVSLQGISHSLFSPPETCAAVLGTAILVAAGFYLLKRRPLSGFGTLFFLINLIPEALLVPQYAFFAYRAVLPMLGIYLLLLDGVVAALSAVREPKRRSVAQAGIVGFFLCAVILMGISTATRASIWGDEIRFWRETVGQFPEKFYKSESRVASQAFTNLGTALYRNGRYSESIEYYNKALELMPTNAVALASRGSAYAKEGNLREAECSLRQAIERDPDLGFAHRSLGNLLKSQNRIEEADRHLQKATDLSAKKALQE